MSNEAKLKESLQDYNSNFKKDSPEAVQLEMGKAHKELVLKEIGKDALKVGDKFPDFKLKNIKSEYKSFDEMFNGGAEHLIISFYRGGWCPYCNLELNALQDNLNNFREAGANLVAITSETPDNSLETAEKNNLDFEILTDEGSKLSKDLNIAFELPENLKPIYEKFGLDIVKHNGDFTLQVPATVIVNKEGVILYSFVDVDYTVRLDPSEILNFLRKH